MAGIYLEKARSKEWLRKEQWTLKKQIYENAIQAITTYGVITARIAATQHNLKWIDALDVAESNRLDLMNKNTASLVALTTDFADAKQKMLSALIAAETFTPWLGAAAKEFRQDERGTLPVEGTTEERIDGLRTILAAVKNLEERLIESIKKDLLF